MKKSILVLFIAMSLLASDAFAELKEVRGVQTRSVSYIDYDSDYKEIKKWGYELKNENKYDVWIEMSRVSSGFTYTTRECAGCREYQVTVDAGDVLDKKSITLKAGESYVWKCGIASGYTGRFYVEYKAYKAE